MRTLELQHNAVVRERAHMAVRGRAVLSPPHFPRRRSCSRWATRTCGLTPTSTRSSTRHPGCTSRRRRPSNRKQPTTARRRRRSSRSSRARRAWRAVVPSPWTSTRPPVRQCCGCGGGRSCGQVGRAASNRSLIARSCACRAGGGEAGAAGGRSGAGTHGGSGGGGAKGRRAGRRVDPWRWQRGRQRTEGGSTGGASGGGSGSALARRR